MAYYLLVDTTLAPDTTQDHSRHCESWDHHLLPAAAVGTFLGDGGPAEDDVAYCVDCTLELLAGGSFRISTLLRPQDFRGAPCATCDGTGIYPVPEPAAWEQATAPARADHFHDGRRATAFRAWALFVALLDSELAARSAAAAVEDLVRQARVAGVPPDALKSVLTFLETPRTPAQPATAPAAADFRGPTKPR